jgi:conjugative relaxase-like TrwC/TraI family protein
VAAIEREESAKTSRRAVAGYDFTFSTPKSASVLWGLGDARLQSMIVAAHHAAVAEVVAFLEREIAATRSGATAADGPVAQVDVAGVIAAGFDHFDSRAGDPHLHTHVVISNKVRTVFDQRWRSLDGRPLHQATVALSELHEAVFADHLTRALGVVWEERNPGGNHNPTWAIAGVPETLTAEFSCRTRDIDTTTDRLVERYVTEHGHRPDPATIMKLRATATLATRPEKQIRSLADLTGDWRTRAEQLLRTDATAWACQVAAVAPPLLWRAEDVTPEVVARIGASVVAAVGEKRSTWRHWNLYAEAARQTMGWRFATTQDRETLIGRVVDTAERHSLRLTPPELAPSPPEFQRADGSSVLRPKHSALYSSEALLAAEDRLLTLANTLTGPIARRTTVATITAQADSQGRTLGADQAAALASVATSGRNVDVLVGPAGAGKTTAMNALRKVWESDHGTGSVIGLAPSAVAAQALQDDLGIPTENTAKWWHDYRHQNTAFRPGQLIIIDEATLADTLTLDRVARHAAQVSAKVLLVGDWAQLQSVDAGGAFTLLVADRHDELPELIDVYRFVHTWEKAASLDLRHGQAAAIEAYAAHDRIIGGDTDEVIDRTYTAWRRDRDVGLDSILIAASTENAAELNQRARADLILTGRRVPGREVQLADGTNASVGDTVITRRNDRRLRNQSDWVRNGDRWEISCVHDDQSVTVRRLGHLAGGLRLPAGYVAEHLELGYAVATFRAQGLTVDTAHAVISPTSTRENLYVAMTRGRLSNTAYVAIDQPDDAHSVRHPADPPDLTARAVILAILSNVGAEQSAHQTIAAEQDAWGSIAQLAAEYETIAAAAQHNRWVALIKASGLPPALADATIASPAFGPLTAELRRAEAYRHDVDTLLPRLVRVRGFANADDIAAVVHARLTRATSRAASSGRTRAAPDLIAGLIPAAAGAMTADMRRALDERRQLIEHRAEALLQTATTSGEAWLRSLGDRPADPVRAAEWRRHALAVTAYRDRYRITTEDPLGSSAGSVAQRLDAFRARTAVEAARRVTADQTTSAV